MTTPNQPAPLIDDPARASELIARRDDILLAARARIAAGDDTYQASLDAHLFANRIQQEFARLAGSAIEPATSTQWRGFECDAEQLAMHHLDNLDRALQWDADCRAQAETESHTCKAARTDAAVCAPNMRCPDCFGHGRWAGDVAGRVTWTCNKCQGTGILPNGPADK